MASGVTVEPRELEEHKVLADDLLVEREFDKVGHYVVQCQSAPSLVCAAWTAVEFGFQGQLIQDPGDMSVPASHVAFTMLSTANGGIAIFSWLDTPPALNRLIRSLEKVSDDRLPDLLLFFAFEYSENCHWNQTWWDTLDPATSASLVLDRGHCRLHGLEYRSLHPRAQGSDVMTRPSSRQLCSLFHAWSERGARCRPT